MIDVIVGKKGSGKNKKLVERANEAVAKGLKLTYDISHQARLIDIDSYSIQGAEALAGFLCGICAGNYDVTDIFVDSTLKIIGPDTDNLVSFVERMNALSSLADTKITLLISMDAGKLPEEIKTVSVQI